MPKALVIYYSRSGHTAKMAEALSEGLSQSKVSVTLVEAEKAKVDDLKDADAVVIGSPCYYGSMAGPLKAFLDESVSLHGKLEGKVGGAFASSGMLGGGNETTVLSIVNALLIHGMVVPGNSRIGHYGTVAVGAPGDKALEECRTYGKRIGDLTQKLFG
jgi:NAD(P)H dehydrogenase (quinone)